MKRKLQLSSIVLTLLVTIASLGLFATESVLTPEVVVDLSRVTAVAVSPGGDAVAYTLEVARKESDKPGHSYSELWVAKLEDGKTRHFAGSGEEVKSPAWSPDGALITFRVKREKVHEGIQIYAIPADGGEARLLTRQAWDVQSYRWSPDGKWIAFAAKDHDTEASQEEKDGGEDWVVWGEEPKHRHLWLLNVETGESQRLFTTDLDAHEIHWTPNSRSIVFQAASTAMIDDEYMFTRIYRVPAAGGQEPEVVTPTEGKLGHMAISPNGENLAYLGATSLNDPIAQSLFVLPLNGGRSRNLTVGYEGSGANLAWENNDTMALLSVEGERHALYDVDAQSGARAPADLDGLVVRQFDYSTATGVLAIAAESAAHPAELFVREPLEPRESGDGPPQRISRHNPALDATRLARQEVIQWKGAGDWDIRGVLTYPLDFEKGKRYPLVLQVHGGPEGVSLDGWTTTPGYPVQLLAGQG